MATNDDQHITAKPKEKALRRRASRRADKQMMREAVNICYSSLDEFITDPVLDGELPDAAADYERSYLSTDGHY